MRTSRDIDLLHRLTAGQHGRITRAQLNRCGVDNTTIARWVADGRLIARVPRVYALGYVSSSREARLWEAVLYAGPGAMLSHLTAARHLGYVTYAPRTLQVSTPRKIASLPGVVVHSRRELPRRFHDGLPVTPAPQTLLDLASQRPELLERALSQADYLQDLDGDEVRAALRRGTPGAKALRAALETYDPNLAALNDEFEITFDALCREWGIEPLPIPNVEVAPRLTVDALWPDHHLGVELDGGANHRSNAQLLRDAERDLVCRGLGLTIIRYRRAQLTRSPERVRADLRGQLALRVPSG